MASSDLLRYCRQEMDLKAKKTESSEGSDLMAEKSHGRAGPLETPRARPQRVHIEEMDPKNPG